MLLHLKQNPGENRITAFPGLFLPRCKALLKYTGVFPALVVAVNMSVWNAMCLHSNKLSGGDLLSTIISSPLTDPANVNRALQPTGPEKIVLVKEKGQKMILIKQHGQCSWLLNNINMKFSYSIWQIQIGRHIKGLVHRQTNFQEASGRLKEWKDLQMSNVHEIVLTVVADQHTPPNVT